MQKIIYINNFNASFAFVSTNSISQGEQVDLLWPIILNGNVSGLGTSGTWTTNGTGSFGNAVLNRFLRTDIAEIRIFGIAIRG